MKKTISSLWSPYDNKALQIKPVMWRLMIPLSLLIVVCILGTGILVYQLHQHSLYDTSTRNVNELTHDMEVLLNEQSSGMLLAITSMTSDPRVIEALRERNSQKLLMQWQKIFETMKKQNHLTHFYFMDKDRVCLLRVHKPAKRGDVIDRFTTMQAKWSRKSAWGLEIGPLGTLTLRVVVPVIVNNDVIGYIELGKEIEDVLHNLHSQSNIHLMMVLHKSYLKQTQWEEGMAILDREGDWNFLKNNVVIYSSFKNTPKEIMSLCDSKAGLPYKYDDAKEISSQGSTYRVSVSALKDVSRKEVGNLIIVNDITNENLEFFDAMSIAGLIGFGIIVVIVGLIYLLLRRTDEWIKNQQQHLVASQNRLEQLAQHSRSIVWEVNEHGVYTYVSDVVCEVLGYDADELIGKYFYDFHPSSGRDAFKQAAMEVFARKEAFTNLRNQVISKEGMIVWLMTNGLPVLAHDGRLSGYRGIDIDITQWQKAEEQINQLAFFDSLTGLPNRALLIDRLHQAMALGDRNGEFCALVFIDLDNFKTLNDTLGHSVGDNLLKQSAQRLVKCIREGDSAARLGGDEYVVLLSNLGIDESHAAISSRLVAEKILTVFNEVYQLDELTYHSTASIGISLFRGDAMSADELMKQADLAMYKSKEAGRNTLRFFDPKMETSLRARTLLEEEIRQGIQQEQFELYYQPQVYSDGRVYGAEVLVRWNHPVRGVVSPAEFIPIAEETGLILPLGEWILKRACRQIAQWSTEEMFEELTVAVNVSARQFSQSDFVNTVLMALEESGANTQRLKLELTESLLVQNVEGVIEKMDRLKSHGIRFSLDDFGTGYSSLSYLKRLPLDQLKIDQSFVRDILVDSNDAIICKSTIALSESMGLSVIAEGVETKEQLDALNQLGCRAYQGYWFSRPLNLEAFEAYQKSLILGKEAL